MKTIIVKLTKAGPTTGPFDIISNGEILALNISRKKLIEGISLLVTDTQKLITIKSVGKCKLEKTFPLDSFTIVDYASSKFTQTTTACMWRHLTNIRIYNDFYGTIEPYILEYPFSFKYQDEIVQSIQDYTKVYTYLPLTTHIFTDNTRIETNQYYFNKAVLYNAQQSTGLLELVSKPLNNLLQYNSYPKYNTSSKTITFTKSDNFYQFNTFWALQKNSQVPLFLSSCQSLSIDKEINQENMNYSTLSFKKVTMRAKDLKVRLIFDNRNDMHLVSQFFLNSSQISYK